MSIQELTQEQFLFRNRCSADDLTAAKISWEDLHAIGVKHESNTPDLKTIVHPVANMLQEFDPIHSVRWRIKDPEHLMEKVMRKRKGLFAKEKLDKGLEKYRDVSVDNYSDIITDLVGVRALYLFKSDLEMVNDFIKSKWKIKRGEKPTLYYRENDQIPDKDLLKSQHLAPKKHPMGYRSTHYVISTSSTKIPVFIEIQARTIFEEAWSEINHQIVYPNHSNDPLLKKFLTILNRLSGSADEMGTFVHELKDYHQSAETKLRHLREERDNQATEMAELVQAVERHKGDSKSYQEKVGKLLKKVRELEGTNTTTATAATVGSSSYIDNSDLTTHPTVPAYTAPSLMGLADVYGAGTQELILAEELARIEKVQEKLKLARLQSISLG